VREQSLRRRIVFVFLAFVSLAAAVLIAVQMRLLEATVYEAVRLQRDQTLELLAEGLGPALFAEDLETIERVAERFVARPGILAVGVRDANGRMLVSRRDDTEKPGEIILEGVREVLFVGRPVGSVQLVTGDSGLGLLTGSTLTRFAAAVLFGLVVAAAALLGLLLREAAWFDGLCRRAAAIAAGDFRSRLPERGPPEVAEVARILNRVLDALDDARRHAEAERRRLATTFKLLPHGVLELDRDGTIVTANPAFHRILGHPDGTLPGRKIWEIPTADGTDCRALVEGLMRGGAEPQPLRIDKLRADGRPVRLRIDWTWLRDGEGERNGILAVATDVTAEEEARERLEESERRFRDFAAAASDWFWETDEEDRIVFVSARMEEVLGLPRQRFLGRRRDDIPEITASPDWPGYLELRAARAPFRGFRYTIRDGNGRERTVETFGVPRFDAEGRFRGYRGVARDITTLVEAERRVHELAYRDSLTGLVNRAAFAEEFERALALAGRRGARLALHVIDLDRFKEVNDTFGHEAGDRLLVEIAGRLRRVTRREDVVARLGGDELAIVQPLVREGSEAAALAERVLAAVREPVDVGGVEVRVGASIGIAVFPDDGHDRQTLLRHADIALYRVKESTRDRYAFFHRDMEIRHRERVELERELRQALESDDGHGLTVFFQPRVRLADGALLGAEVLARWHHPERGEIPPSVFVALAERCGLVHLLGERVLEQALCQLAAWDREGRRLPRVSVNLSPVQFLRRDLVKEIRAVLVRTGVDASRLELEITEGALVHDVEHTADMLRRLRDLGVDLALDDFGTGYSSLAYLRRFPLDRLKIDASFVRGLPESPEQVGIVRAILDLARNLRLGCVAEGIESEAARDFLLRHGCREGQGFLFDGPCPAATFAARWLAAPSATEGQGGGLGSAVGFG